MSDSGVFKLGDCPVCRGAGAVLLLRRRSDGQLVPHCPSCGCTWLEPPDSTRLDSVRSLAEVAPGGVDLPEWRALAVQFGADALVAADEWLEFLDLGSSLDPR